MNYRGNRNKVIMYEDEYVYCTDCVYFRLDDEFTPYCLFEDECDIEDCEDSRHITERPKYKWKGEIDE